jgi:hypothetical protein
MVQMSATEMHWRRLAANSLDAAMTYVRGDYLLPNGHLRNTATLENMVAQRCPNITFDMLTLDPLLYLAHLPTVSALIPPVDTITISVQSTLDAIQNLIPTFAPPPPAPQPPVTGMTDIQLMDILAQVENTSAINLAAGLDEIQQLAETLGSPAPEPIQLPIENNVNPLLALLNVESITPAVTPEPETVNINGLLLSVNSIVNSYLPPADANFYVDTPSDLEQLISAPIAGGGNAPSSGGSGCTAGTVSVAGNDVCLELTLTFNNATGSCTGFDGGTVTLTSTGSTSWAGSATINGVSVNVTLSYLLTWTLSVYGGTCVWSPPMNPTSTSYGPFVQEWDNITIGTCCSGAIEATVTD